MIITCPNCSTRFLLDDADMPQGGRKVRCARCSHVWHEAAPGGEPSLPLQEPGSTQTAADTPPPSDPATTPELEPTTPKPQEKSKSPIIWVLIALVLIGIGIGGVAYLMPKEFNSLLGLQQDRKPAVVKTPAGWGRPAPMDPVPTIPAEPEATTPATGPAPTTSPMPTTSPTPTTSNDTPPTLPALPADEGVDFSDSIPAETASTTEEPSADTQPITE